MSTTDPSLRPQDDAAPPAPDLYAAAPADKAPALARPITLPYAPQPAPRWAPIHLLQLSRRDAALDLGLIVLTLLVFPYGLQFVSLFLKSTAPVPRDAPLPVSFVISQIGLEAAATLCVAGYLIWRHRLSRAAFGFRLGPVSHEVGWSTAALASVYVTSLVSAALIFALVMTFPSLQADLKHRLDFFRMLPLSNLATTAVLLVPVAIHEEVLFRGLLLPYLRRLTGTWSAAIVVSALVFAALHLPQGVLGACQIVFVGAALGLVFVRTQRLLPVLVAHYLFDFIQAALATYLLNGPQGFPKLSG